MKTSLGRFKHDLLDGVLALMWRQWTLLGVSGQSIERSWESNEPAIIDPEALLLVTSELGRFDARLFDESLNWLRQFGKLINIQRVKSLLQLHHFGNRQILAGMASTVSENARLSKWRALETPDEKRSGLVSLFRDKNGDSMRSVGTHDTHFEKFGYLRGKVLARASATPPKVGNQSELLLIKLRALLGVNARAEIIAALLSMQTAHPSALARRIAYLPRSVQDTLNEMVFSGHVLSTRPKGSREKYFSLRPGDWTFLLTWDSSNSRLEPRFPSWIEWSIIFALLQDTITLLYSEEIKNVSPLMAALRVREIYELHAPLLAEAGLAGNFIDTPHRSGLEFLETFLLELRAL